MNIIEKVKELLAKRISGYNIGDLVPIVVGFALVGVIGGVVLLILGNFAGGSVGNTCSGANVIGTNSPGLCSAGPTYFSVTYNGLNYGVSGINQLMSFLPLIALVVVAAVIIGTVVGAFVLGGGATKEF